MFNIVLVEPEIPQNTGNIARSCAVTGASLHLVKPLGFSVDDRHLKRAGLDYWHLLDLHYYDSFEHLKQSFPDSRFFYSTTKTKKSYAEMFFSPGDFLVFGKLIITSTSSKTRATGILFTIFPLGWFLDKELVKSASFRSYFSNK
jgi:tRNA (cytidine(34)-2'-O)-methyltransferase